jgi:hypothetical protein
MTTIEYITDVIEGMRSVKKDYKGVRSMTNELIDSSEYSLSFFAKQLKLFFPVFYIKKKTNTFSFDEIQKIVAVLKQENEEKSQLIRELDEMKRTQRTLSAEEFKQMLQQ